MLRFLMGLRDPEVVLALEQHGFTEADRLEGYALIRQLTDERLGKPPPPPTSDDLLPQLDAFENFWFPIARAILRPRYPVVHERVFRKLKQTEGNALLLSVSTFVRRLDELRDEGGAEAEAALAHLARRGLDEAALDEVRQLLATVAHDAPDPLAHLPSPETLAAAEDALWAWYIEWSAISRAAIKAPRLLRQLGFRHGEGSTADN